MPQISAIVKYIFILKYSLEFILKPVKQPQAYVKNKDLF